MILRSSFFYFFFIVLFLPKTFCQLKTEETFAVSSDLHKNKSSTTTTTTVLSEKNEDSSTINPGLLNEDLKNNNDQDSSASTFIKKKQPTLQSFSPSVLFKEDRSAFHSSFSSVLSSSKTVEDDKIIKDNLEEEAIALPLSPDKKQNLNNNFNEDTKQEDDLHHLPIKDNLSSEEDIETPKDAHLLSDNYSHDDEVSKSPPEHEIPLHVPLTREDPHLRISSVEEDSSPLKKDPNCPPTVLLNGTDKWRTTKKIISLLLPPIQADNPCIDPSNCKISSVHKIEYLQEGDSLQVLLEENGLLEKNASHKIHLSSTKEPMKDHKSFLTIWKVTASEWTTCSTREGGKVAENREDGAVLIQDKYLLTGTHFFIGRSSWSSSECFKIKVIIKSADCGEKNLCSSKGNCISNTSMTSFSCDCCDRYHGKHCEELNACFKKPCFNNGICLDIQEGHDGNTFQCLCPYGFKGDLCENASSLCDSNPCQNNGYCEGNHTYYNCHCPMGWTGPQCMEEVPYDFEKKNEEEIISDDELYSDSVQHSNPDGEGCVGPGEPCIHGVCVESTSREISCFCQPGFGGNRCEYEYDECCSNPCQNGGTCVDHIGDYECKCGPGYTGHNCLQKVNLCEMSMCPLNRNCIDRGNFFTCECLEDDITDNDCSSYEEVCDPNPCNHGGSCYAIMETQRFYCACRPGYTGQTCQDASILESVVPIEGSMEDETGRDKPRKDLDSLASLKNVYTGILTLACAFMLFLFVLSICHCLVSNENNDRKLKFLRFVFRLLPSSFVRRRSNSIVIQKRSRGEECTSLRMDSDSEGASVPMNSHHASGSSSVFYNMDCDNQPLIK